MQDYRKYSDEKLIEIYRRLREDFKTEQSNNEDNEASTKVYTFFINAIKAELKSRGMSKV